VLQLYYILQIGGNRMKKLLLTAVLCVGIFAAHVGLPASIVQESTEMDLWQPFCLDDELVRRPPQPMP